MMVIFTSLSEKKAIRTTRWILDAFADRIGKDVWQTVITAEGLQMVHSLLRRHATKNMSVSCRWLRSRSRSELLWVVGDRSRFSTDGRVPVNSTQQDLQHHTWENDWHYLPHIKALTAVAALLHDWGKGNDAFQAQLRPKPSCKERYRHEWLSCQLIAGLVTLSGDAEKDIWLDLLLERRFDERALVATVNQHMMAALGQLPPVASLLCWLILSHHRLPLPDKNTCTGYAETERQSVTDTLAGIDATWGYVKDEAQTGVVQFSHGLLQDAVPWRRQLERWLPKLQAVAADLADIWQKDTMRPILLYSRLCLMLGDYYCSAQSAAEHWQGQKTLFANTYQGKLKQKLDEHLVGVAREALHFVHYLPALVQSLPRTERVSALCHKSPAAYSWQDKAVQAIRNFQRQQAEEHQDSWGYFVVNMASTGCGKTFANAKIMQALAKDHKTLRYILALGLRTLTLQTGDAYRQKLHLSKDELAVLVGSAAMRQLHEEAAAESRHVEDASYDTQYAEELLQGELDGTFPLQDEFLDMFFKGGSEKQQRLAVRQRQLLYQPVLVSTIDHLMPATETLRGGRFMLPFLRLMSSDLVIDEVDDFSPRDLVAIARLVHLAGMLGRNVTISSATIPPDLARGLFAAYMAGRRSWGHFLLRPVHTAVVWCDEFRSLVQSVPSTASAKVFSQFHQDFVAKRVRSLQAQPALRCGTLVRCAEVRDLPAAEREAAYFAHMLAACVTMHQAHCCQDTRTGKYFSLGLVRMANIEPCVRLAQYMLQADWPDGIEPRLMVYHSRQLLLMRHEQEQYLDKVLQREKIWQAQVEVRDEVMHQHLAQAEGKHVLFLVLATPVEEVGRDHDFDWAVVEPSSYRSIVQLAGRVLRHRKLHVPMAEPNIAVMQYNDKEVRRSSGTQPVFCHPGFEDSSRYRLKTHDMAELVDEAKLQQRIDAIPRIVRSQRLHPHDKLVDLEHQVMQDFADIQVKGATHLHGWQDEYWYLTGVSQRLNPFRAGSQDLTLHLCWQDGAWSWQERSERTDEFINRTQQYGIAMTEAPVPTRLWLQRDYLASLRARAQEDGEISPSLFAKAWQRFGYLTVPLYGAETGETQIAGNYCYNDQFGLYRK